MNRFERIGLTLCVLAILGILAGYLGKVRFPDDETAAMLVAIRSYLAAILFTVIYNSLPVNPEKKE